MDDDDDDYGSSYKRRQEMAVEQARRGAIGTGGDWEPLDPRQRSAWRGARGIGSPQSGEVTSGGYLVRPYDRAKPPICSSGD